MSSGGAAETVRITLATGAGQIDVELPADIPICEYLGRLIEIAHPAAPEADGEAPVYALAAVGGTRIPLTESLGAAGIVDGAILMLVDRRSSDGRQMAAEGHPPGPRLRVRTPHGRIELDPPGPYRVGRRPDAEVSFPDHVAFVHRDHAVLELERGCWVLTNRGANGIYNKGGKRVERVELTESTRVFLATPHEGIEVTFTPL